MAQVLEVDGSTRELPLPPGEWILAFLPEHHLVFSVGNTVRALNAFTGETLLEIPLEARRVQGLAV
ncbi:MAG: hypothetical protein AB2A00_33725 [Myxococcota bacterium]